MKDLKDYIKESILDDIDVQIDNTYEIIKNQIKKFICDNYICDISKIKISQNPNKNGKYRVESKSKDAIKTIGNISELTNGMFNWGYVYGDFIIHSANISTLEGAPTNVVGAFSCSCCKNLKSLKSAPKECGDFDCSSCDSLISLKGAPKEVRGTFKCKWCKSLTSLEGAPEKTGNFDCSHCKSLKSLEGAPKKVFRTFACSYCDSLTSLEGAPKEVGEVFYCTNCKGKFTNDDIAAVSNVSGEIETYEVNSGDYLFYLNKKYERPVRRY